MINERRRSVPSSGVARLRTLIDNNPAQRTALTPREEARLGSRKIGTVGEFLRPRP
jgi:hypothetical protein